MEKKYLTQLPAQTSLLVEEIEDYSGKWLEVRPNPYPISGANPNPLGLACMVDERSARIYIRSEAVDPHAFTHELLHIHRYWVRKVPQVLPVNDPAGIRVKVTSSIENAIEHLVIVPEEEQFGFEPFAYWNETCRANWERFEPQNMEKFAIKKNCLLGWLSISGLVTDPDVARKAQGIIKKQGFLQKAQQMAFKVRRTVDSKEKQIRCVVDCLGISRAEVKLVYFDPRSTQRFERAVQK